MPWYSPNGSEFPEYWKYNDYTGEDLYYPGCYVSYEKKVESSYKTGMIFKKKHYTSSWETERELVQGYYWKKRNVVVPAYIDCDGDVRPGFWNEDTQEVEPGYKYRNRIVPGVIQGNWIYHADDRSLPGQLHYYKGDDNKCKKEIYH